MKRMIPSYASSNFYLQLAVLTSIACINFNSFITINNIYIVMSSVLLLVIFLFSSWNLLQYALVLFLIGISTLVPSVIWSIPAMTMLIPVVISTIIIYQFPRTKIALTWFTRGRIDNLSLILMVLTSITAAAALIIWGSWSNNLGLPLEMMKSLTVYPAWLNLCILIPLFGIINAFAEEAIYRGIIQEALIHVFPKKILLVILLQASAFAAAHVAFGFPNGKLGYIMTFLYGNILGYLRFRTKGMLSPYITHVAADLVIGYFLYSIT